MKPWHYPTPIDFIALCALIVSGIAVYTTKDAYATQALVLVVGYYFGKKSSTLPPQDPRGPGA